MARLRFLPATRQDLLDVWARIARENLRAADKVIDRIETACRFLGDHPVLGPARLEVGEGARALIIDRWLALYRLEPLEVQIVRVVDGARDLKKLSFNPE